MHNFYFYKKQSIYYSFIGIMILQLTLSYAITWHIQPSWSMMSLIYWVIMTPKQVNIGTGFVLGLITDGISSSILGMHALSFSIISYLIIRKNYLLQNVSIFQQIFFVIFFSLIDQSLKVLITFLITKVLSSSDFFWNCILNGVLWPFLFFLMRKVYTHQ